MNNKLTIAIPYYNSPRMLEKQMECWDEYPPEVRRCIEVIVVDDGSPIYLAADVIISYGLPEFSLKLYCVQENIPWNITGALNLAFTEARNGWMFSGAVDHVIPVESMVRLCARLPELDSRTYYRFKRYKNSLNEEARGRGNLFLLTRKLFWEVGGYDEDFAGWYGGAGYLFRRALNKQAQVKMLDDIYTLTYTSDVIPDARVEDWGRTDSDYYWKRSKELREVFQEKQINYNPERHLRFNWEKVF